MDDNLEFSYLDECSDVFSDENRDIPSLDKDEPPKPKAGLKHLQEMKSIFGLDSFKEKQAKRKLRRKKHKKRRGKVTEDG